MKEDKDILKQIDHRDGMTVPEGYFAAFAAHMADSLPTTPFEESAENPIPMAPRTFWQKVRPYVYMAAMFGGVWCMLKMFTLLTASSSDRGWEPTPVLAEALNNEIFVNEYIIDNVDERDLMEDMIASGFDLTSFSDFDDMEAMPPDSLDDDNLLGI